MQSAPMFSPMFLPPRENRLLHKIKDIALPAIANAVAGLREVRVPEEDLERLRGVRGRALLSPNHPTGNDPIVIIWISRMIGERFNYLAAREVFTGPKGWLLNQLGAYSVIRGIADRESLRFTRRLLAEHDRKVVIFPEGEIYEHNDTLLVFQSGVAQIGFWALEDMVKAGKAPVLPLFPLAIKYRCLDSPRLAIENSLMGLEKALDLARRPGDTSYTRLQRIGDRLLVSVERDLGLRSEEGGELGPRIEKVRRRKLQQVAAAIGEELDERLAPQEQLHKLQAELRAWVGAGPDEASDYDERLYNQRVATAAPLFVQLERLQNWIAVRADYIGAQATAERFLDVLGRLEKEVFGDVRNRVAREALVRICEPIPLEERLPAYRENKRQAVAQVTAELEETIRQALRELSEQSTPIALDA